MTTSLPTTPIRVLVADDHPLMREGIVESPHETDLLQALRDRTDAVMIALRRGILDEF